MNADKPSYTLKFANTMIAEFSDLLYPFSPIEVRYEDRQFHIFCEGEWCQAENDRESLVMGLSETIKKYGQDWKTPSLHIMPDWPGWMHLKEMDYSKFEQMYEDNDDEDFEPEYEEYRGDERLNAWDEVHDWDEPSEEDDEDDEDDEE